MLRLKCYKCRRKDAQSDGGTSCPGKASTLGVCLSLILARLGANRGDGRAALDPYVLDTKPDGTVQFHLESLTKLVNLKVPVPKGQFFHVAAIIVSVRQHAMIGNRERR